MFINHEGKNKDCTNFRIPHSSLNMAIRPIYISIIFQKNITKEIKNKMSERVQIILSNNFSYTGVIINQDDFFIYLKDKFGEKVTIGKKDVQVIKEVKDGR